MGIMTVIKHVSMKRTIAFVACVVQIQWSIRQEDDRGCSKQNVMYLLKGRLFCLEKLCTRVESSHVYLDPYQVNIYSDQ